MTCEACGELREGDILVAGYGSSDGSAVMLWKRLTAAEAGGATTTPIPMGNPNDVAHVTITVDGTMAGQPVNLDGPGDDDNLQLELVVDGVPVDTLVLTLFGPARGDHHPGNRDTHPRCCRRRAGSIWGRMMRTAAACVNRF